MTADELYPVLCNLCRMDAGTPERLDKYWEPANRLAADHVVKVLPELKAKYPVRGGSRDYIYQAVKEARRVRSEYLAGVV